MERKEKYQISRRVLGLGKGHYGGVAKEELAKLLGGRSPILTDRLTPGSSRTTR
jgi:hypothetical protein